MDRRCIFIGGKQIGVNCLKILVDLGIKPLVVIPNPDDNGKKTWHDSLKEYSMSKKLNIISTPLKDRRTKELLETKKPEIIFCIGSTRIIPLYLLLLPELGCLNIHPALLPNYRGRYSTVHAIFNNENITGVTAHWMDQGIDTGPIILQKKIKILKSDTAKSLYDKFTRDGEKLFVKIVKMWLNNKKIKSHKQGSNGSYYPKELPNNGQIDWNWDGNQIFNFIRCMTFEPFSPVTFMIGDKKMVIVDEKYFKGFK